MKKVITLQVNSIKDLYIKTAALISRHIKGLLAALKNLNVADPDVLNLGIVKILSKLFIDLLTVIATAYELVRHVMTWHTHLKTMSN